MQPAMMPALRRAEDLADLRLPELDLLVDRLEHALQRRLDLVDRGVDHRVVADVHALAVGQLGRLALRPDVEADDDRIRRRRQADVGLGDRTDTAVDDPQADLVADVDLGQGVLQGLDRTSAVALEDEPQLLRLALLELLEQLVEGLAPGAGRLGRHPQPRRRAARRSAGPSGRRRRRGSCRPRRGRRSGRAPGPGTTAAPRSRCAVVVEQRPDPAVRRYRRRSSRRRAACRAGPGRWRPGRDPCPGAPRWPHPDRPSPGWPAGRGPRRRSG